MKKEYEVRIVVTACYRCFVEADNAYEAEELAESMYYAGELSEDNESIECEAERTDGEPEDEDEED